MPFDTLSRIIQNGLCCGCGSCSNSCEKQLISMEENAAGFLYPILTHPEICTGCDNCNKSCPIITHTDKNNQFSEIISYHGHVADLENLKSCSSGGIATALSESIIEKGGIVFGVRYSQDFTKAIYSKIETLDGLEDLKGTKYIQPETGTCFGEVKKELDSGRLILFIGLPCVISGLKTFLKKKYDNLITCDLICYGVTSPKISAEYIHRLCSRYNSSLRKFSVRYKYGGNWLPPYIRAEFVNNNVHMERFYQSDYGWGFTQFSRPSCYHCFCKENGSSADITLGDAHGCRENEQVWTRHGVSVIFVHTIKGEKYLDAVTGITLDKTTYLHASAGNPYLETSRKKSKNYEKFNKYLTTKNLQVACNKTYSLPTKILRKLPISIVDVLLQNKILCLLHKSRK